MITTAIAIVAVLLTAGALTARRRIGGHESKGSRSEAADPEAFDRQLDSLNQQQVKAKGELTHVKEAAGTDDYSEARRQFDATIGEMEDGIAQARKQLRGSGSQ
jgi:hypothetical protein